MVVDIVRVGVCDGIQQVCCWGQGSGSAVGVD